MAWGLGQLDLSRGLDGRVEPGSPTPRTPPQPHPATTSPSWLEEVGALERDLYLLVEEPDPTPSQAGLSRTFVIFLVVWTLLVIAVAVQQVR